MMVKSSIRVLLECRLVRHYDACSLVWKGETAI